MKNIIIAILLVVIGLLVYHIHTTETDAIEPQETEQNTEPSTATSTHLKFKGIPIDGSIDDFASKLEKNGFESEKTYNGDIFYKGDFAGYNCRVLLESTPSGIVCTVKALMENHDEWQPIENDYMTLKAALTKKYGKPTKCIEKFYGYSQPERNSAKYIGLISGECNYVTTFETTNGTIILSIIEESIGGCPALVYQDKENSQIAAGDMLDEL